MIKLLINITDLLKRLGFLAVFLLPCVGLVLVGFAIFLILIGVGLLFKILIKSLVVSRSQAKLIKAFAYEVETKAKTEALNNLS